jgi:hypothetical protein
VLEQHRSVQHDESMGMTEDETSRHLPLGGYVVSNDMFHDAIRRDDSRHHHNKLPINARSVSLKGWLLRVARYLLDLRAAAALQGDDGRCLERHGFRGPRWDGMNDDYEEDEDGEALVRAMFL